MTKKIRNRRANYFGIGGFSWQKDASFGKNMANAFNSGALSSAIGATSSIVGQGISGGLSSGAGSAIQGLGNIANAIPGPWGAIAGGGLNIIGGAVNRLFGSQINEQAVANFRNQNSQQSNTTFKASTTNDLVSQGNFGLLGLIEQDEVGKDGWFSNKAKKLTAELNRQRAMANNQIVANYRTAASNLDTQNDLNALANYAAFGGPLHTHGADWTNGITIIDNGGSHESNPFEGVPMGIAPDGKPNLVEEGEVIFNDYVFSDRMNVPNSMRSSLGLSKGKNLTFAKAAKKLSKEAEERPNDPISRRGLFASMSKLQQAQETVRQQNQESQEGVQYARGGRLGTLFDGTGPESNYLGSYNHYKHYKDYLDNIYGKNPYPTFTGNVYAQKYHPPYTEAPDDNELLDIARVRAGEEPKGKITPVLEPLINSDSNNTNNTTNNSNLAWLRYAPVVGAAIGLGQNIFSKPDYSSSDAILNAANEAGRYTPVGFNPLGDYLTYRPFDRNYYINKLNAQSDATRRAIVNQSAGNRATALAGLLAADYNAQGKLGDLARQAEEYNLGQREKVATFNRGTNQFNSEMGLKATMANQKASLEARSQRLRGVTQAMQVRDAVDERRGASMSANLTNLFNSIGDIGREAATRNMILSNPALYYSIDSTGKITYKNGYESLSDAAKDEVNRHAATRTKTKAHGGYITIRRRR